MEDKLKEVMEIISEYKDESDFNKHTSDTLGVATIEELLANDVIHDITPRVYSDISHLHELTPIVIYEAVKRGIQETYYYEDVVIDCESLHRCSERGLSEHELLMMYLETYYRVFTLNGHLYITNN